MGSCIVGTALQTDSLVAVACIAKSQPACLWAEGRQMHAPSQTFCDNSFLPLCPLDLDKVIHTRFCLELTEMY